MKKKKKDNAKKKAWTHFSRFIRLSAVDENGLAECVTCPPGTPKKHWKELQAGHFVDGRNNTVLLKEELVHCQCFHCNFTLSGNKVQYVLFMLRKGHTLEELEAFDRLKHATCKVSQEEWRELALYYKTKADLLEKNMGDPLDFWE